MAPRACPEESNFKVIGYETDEKGISSVVETVQLVMKREAAI